MTASPSTDLRQPWNVVLVGFVALAVAGGIGFYVFPVYVELIRRDLDATLTHASLALGLISVTLISLIRDERRILGLGLRSEPR